MPRWTQNKKSEEPKGDDIKIEVEGLVAQCEMCKTQTDTTWYLPEVQALTWKCTDCDHVNILTDFRLPQ